MPKPKKPSPITSPIGRKFHQIMDEKGITGDYKALADAFGVKAPSVYGWIRHTRIAKDKYARLVEWSGRSLHWWFDLPEHGAAQSQPAPPMLAQQTKGVYDLKPSQPWPFSRPLEAFSRLSDIDRGRVDGYMTALIENAEGNGGRSDAQRVARQGP